MSHKLHLSNIRCTAYGDKGSRFTMKMQMRLAATGSLLAAALGFMPMCMAGGEWDSAFPQVKGFELTVKESKCQSRKLPEYSRTAVYSDGSSSLKVTIARSTRFAQLLAKKQLPQNAKPGILNSHAIWTMEGTARKGPQLMLRINKSDKLLKIQSDEPGWSQKKLCEFARNFDLNKLDKTLSNPPQQEIAETKNYLKLYSDLKPGTSMSNVLAALGPPDHDLGSGDFRLIYELEDGSKIQVYGKSSLKGVQHILADGSTVNLI